ncbi:MAG: DUF255 domain-containing protein [Pseudomonadales bacterium]
MRTTRKNAPRRRIALRVAMRLLLCGALTLQGGIAAHGATNPNADEAGIAWQPWSEAAFAAARSQRRMIILDVGIEGCTACRSMEAVTYRDPRTISLVSQHFVPIQVDAEARPDIGDRYSDWAWPATVFLDPEGRQVLALRGNRLPRNFLPILEDLIARHAANQLDLASDAPYDASPEPAATDLSHLRDTLRQRFRRSLETDAFSSNSGPRLRHAFLLAHMTGDTALRERALRAAEGYLALLDPEWGGVYVAAREDGSAVPEKRISNQAGAIHVLASAAAVTGDPRFAEGLGMILDYLASQMRSLQGTYFTSQQDRPKGLPPEITREQYWALPAAERMLFGLPATDTAVYSDKNGELIEALAHAYAVTSDTRYRDAAEIAARSLLESRLMPEGWIQQAEEATPELDSASRLRRFEALPKPYLSAQAAFGSGLLALYGVTGEDMWLAAATGIAAALKKRLEDSSNGGFFATPPETAVAPVPPRKPLEQNARAAHFLYDLSVYRKDSELARTAERTIRAAAGPEAVRREGRVTGELALALEKITAAYVEFSVVGDPADPRAASLFAAARRVHHPRKLLHFEAPGRYPDRGRPALYICNPDMCSAPIHDPTLVFEQAARIVAAAVTPYP